jgi:hypothetical protein
MFATFVASSCQQMHIIDTAAKRDSSVNNERRIFATFTGTIPVFFTLAAQLRRRVAEKFVNLPISGKLAF